MPSIVDIHPHVIATDNTRYPLNPLGGVQSTWSRDRPTPFEALVADIVFARVAGGDVLDPAFRASCAGTYQSGPTKHVVALDPDGQITLSPTGQPTYRLVPYQHRTFTIKELEGFRVEFERDEAGAVNTIVFHQPNGTFVAHRSESDDVSS